MFYWKDSYSCNVGEIDEQHKKLFEIGSRVYSVASSKNKDIDKYDDIMSTLDELRDYTIKHFKYEETILSKLNYPQYETHKIEHDFFIKKIERISRKDIEEAQDEAVLEILTFVADWISSHILKKDMEYKEFLNGKGII